MMLIDDDEMLGQSALDDRAVQLNPLRTDGVSYVTVLPLITMSHEQV